MNNQKDELITGAELAKRLGVNRSYISNNKNKLKEYKCTYGKKFYYLKSCECLGRNPDDKEPSKQSELQKDIKKIKKEEVQNNDNWQVITDKQEIQKAIDKFAENEDEEENIEDEQKDEAKELLDQILTAIKKGSDIDNRKKLDVLIQKARVLREYFTAKNEEIKNRKLEENLFDRDEVIKLLGFAMNMVRNSLVNMPNNYATNLEGMNQKEIKEYVSDDINKILENLQEVGNQFE